jgi:hypothetical protein
MTNGRIPNLTPNKVSRSLRGVPNDLYRTLLSSALVLQW